eukprot:3897221-Alexandrium_andersonii.AAC.1
MQQRPLRQTTATHPRPRRPQMLPPQAPTSTRTPVHTGAARGRPRRTRHHRFRTMPSRQSQRP